MKCRLIKQFVFFEESHWFVKIVNLPYQPWPGLTFYVGPCSLQPNEYQRDEVEEVFGREQDDYLTCRMTAFRCGDGMGTLEDWIKHFRDYGWKLVSSGVDPHTLDFMSKTKSPVARKVPTGTGISTARTGIKKKAAPRQKIPSKKPVKRGYR